MTRASEELIRCDADRGDPDVENHVRYRDRRVEIAGTFTRAELSLILCNMPPDGALATALDGMTRALSTN